MSRILRPSRLQPQEASHQVLTLFGVSRFIAWHLMRLFFVMTKRPEAFFGMQSVSGHYPGIGLTFKKPLCRTRSVDGTYNKYHPVLWIEPPVKYWLFVYSILCFKTYFLIKLFDLFSFSVNSNIRVITEDWLMSVCLFVYVCVWEKERGRDWQTDRQKLTTIYKDKWTAGSLNTSWIHIFNNYFQVKKKGFWFSNQTDKTFSCSNNSIQTSIY